MLYRSKFDSVAIWPHPDSLDLLALMNKGDMCLLTSNVLERNYVSVLFDGVIGWVLTQNLEKVCEEPVQVG